MREMGGISHPACERLSQAPEGVDGAVPWGSDTVSEELSGLTKDVERYGLWTGGDYPALLT